MDHAGNRTPTREMSGLRPSNMSKTLLHWAVHTHLAHIFGVPFPPPPSRFPQIISFL